MWSCFISHIHTRLPEESLTMKVIVYLLGPTTIAMSSFFILYTRETINAFKTFFGTVMIAWIR